MSFRQDWPIKNCLYCNSVMYPQQFFSNLSRADWEKRKYCTTKCAARHRNNIAYEPLEEVAPIGEAVVSSDLHDRINLMFLRDEVAEYEYEYDRFSD